MIGAGEMKRKVDRGEECDLFLLKQRLRNVAVLRVAKSEQRSGSEIRVKCIINRRIKSQRPVWVDRFNLHRLGANCLRFIQPRDSILTTG